MDPTVILQDDHTVLERADGDLFQRYPTTRWREGELFIETRQLTMPVTLEPLELAIEEGNRIQPLGQIRVDLSALQWTVRVQATEICASFQDVGTLRGYMWEVDYLDDNEAQVVDDDHLTLFWEAGENAPTATSYTVFAHLLAPDGRIVVQDDGLPAEGERPTNGWLPREVIADEHQFDLPEDIPDDSWFSVGLYNLVTLERVPAFDCEGRRLDDDALIFSVPELD